MCGIYVICLSCKLSGTDMGGACTSLGPALVLSGKLVSCDQGGANS